MALAAQGKAPEWVMLIPAGQFDTNDGRWFNNANPDGVVQAFAAEGLDLPFDFEHGSEIRARKGEFAPAAGWIVELANRDGAIWGRVNWTERGRAAIEAREVKYISPAIYHNADNFIEGLSSAALTVRPAISTLPAIASRQTPTETNLMDKKALCAAVGLPETATDAEILAAVTKTKSDLALASQQPSLERFVPRADYDLVVKARDTAQTALASRDADQLKAQATAEVEKGIAEGKIAPVNKDYYLATCATQDGLDKFKAFLTTAPAVVKTKAEADPAPKGSGLALTSDQKKVARSLGISEADYATQLEADKKDIAE